MADAAAGEAGNMESTEAASAATGSTSSSTAAAPPKPEVRSWADDADEEDEKPAPPADDEAEEVKRLEALRIKEEEADKETKDGRGEGLDEPEDSAISAVTTGETVYTSAVSFENLNLSKELIRGLYVEMGFKRPSKIQAVTLPMILTPPYKNLVAQAHNGSGKTTCFVLGMLSRVDPQKKLPQALCICPTRELAQQNEAVLLRMGKYTGITSVCAIPTDSAHYVPIAKRAPVTEQVVIGTPGTIKKWMSAKKLSTRDLKILVFDEADHMLAEDGFRDDSERIMKEIERNTPSCQVLLFSATFNETVKAPSPSSPPKASPMAGAPSSGPPEQREEPEEEGEQPPPSSPPPAPPPTTTTMKSRDSPPKPQESPPSPATSAVKPFPDPAVLSASAPAAGESAGPKTLAITVPVALNSDVGPDGGHGSGECRRSFSQLLAGAMASPMGSSFAMPIVAVPVDAVRVPVVAVPCFIAPAALLESSGFTGQFAMTHQAVLATVTAQAQVQLQSGYAPSPTIPTIAPVPTQQSPPSASEGNVLSPEVDQQPSSDQKLQSAQIVLKTTSGDKFNWRKYGQKQVKSSESSRSYYRCTQANCSAKKKVERCQDGRVIEVVYKGGHNHDPPQKVKCSKERKRQSIVPSGDSEASTLESREANGSVPSQSKVEQDSGSDTPEQQLHCSSDCEADASIKAEEDLDEEPDLKRRLTERSLASPSPRFKAVKEPKVVVQKSGDTGPSSDGYRWRKYGQKLVKGNPNPRSYYKCTQIGCPVRKHVERDSADAKAIIIQYEGKHNHDLPTPRGVCDPPATALLIAAAAAAAIDAEGCIGSPGSVEKSPGTLRRPDVDSNMTSEKASELEGDKALESAQALLSIGFKSAASEEDGRRDGSDVKPRPLFDDNLVVSVQNS